MIESKWKSGNGNGHNGNGHNGNGSNGKRLVAPPRTVRDFVAIAFRRRRLMVLSFVALFLGGILGILLFPAHYQGEMSILVDTSRINPVISSKPEILQTAQKLSDDELNTEMGILTSRDVLQKTVEDCRLYELDPWDSSPLAAVETAQFKLMSALGLAPGLDTRIYKSTLKLEEKLDVVPIPDSHMIKVDYESPFPDRSQCVVSALSKAYFEKHLSLQRPSRASGAFGEETQNYEKQLMGAEARMIDFAKNQGAITPTAQEEIAVKNMNDFDVMYKQAEASVADTRERIRDLTTQLNSTPGRIVTQYQTEDNAILLQNLKNTLLSLENQRIDLLTKFAPTYRPVQDIDKQIDKTRTAIAEAEQTPIHNQTTDVNPTTQWIYQALAQSRADLVGNEARAEALGQAVRTYQAKALDFNRLGWVQQDMMRSVKLNEDNFFLYRHKEEEAKSSEILDAARITNVAMAEPPIVPLAPVGLPLPVKFALAMIVAVMVSIGTGLLAEFNDRSVRTPEELEAALDLPVLASIPKNGHSKTMENHVSGII